MSEKSTVAFLTRDKGYGAWVKVTIADTPAADAAAAAFFRNACRYVSGQNYHAAHVDEEASTGLGSEMADYFYPICPHGLSLNLCDGPGHYPMEH